MRVLVAGAGWLGSAIARALLADGHQVVAVRRRAPLLRPLVEACAIPLVLDLARDGAERLIPAGIDAIVACQAARGDSEEAYRAAYVYANRALLDAAERDAVRSFVYTGSTGLFGQRGGEEVTEASSPAPAGPSGVVLVEAEREVLNAASLGLPTRIVRLSGLYGPGRTGIVDRVRSGQFGLGPGDDAWMNFCHLDDAVGFVMAALLRGEDGRVYHGSDAAPARRREVVQWIAERLGISPPLAAGAPPGPNRRVDSSWSRAALGIELRHPSFRDGLAPLWDAPSKG
jgi:nucleoside-diphosphate-sugar epimerase